jgi:type II secretory pathway pseudopilin PulG
VNTSCSPVGRRQRLAAAFTLVEALLSISVAALAASVLLLGITSSVQTTDEALQQTIAGGMAQQLLDEVVGGRYMELGCSPYDTYLCPGAAETAPGTRELFDDIDDYNGFRSRPPTDLWGIGLGKDDGEGGERHPDFQAPAGFFDNWREEIDVYYVSPSDLTAGLAAGQVSDYRAVVVRVLYVDPEGGERVLAELRRVVAYVPPL